MTSQELLQALMDGKRLKHVEEEFYVFMKDGCLVNEKDEPQVLDFSLPERWKIYKSPKTFKKKVMYAAVTLTRYNQYELSNLPLFNTLEEAQNICIPFFGAIPVEVYIEGEYE